MLFSNKEEKLNHYQKLSTIREQCKKIYNLGLENKLKYFKLNLDNLDEVSNTLIDYIKENYPDLKIPDHSRLRHIEFIENNIIDKLFQKWNDTKINNFKNLIDLITISSIMDAGSGDSWIYKSKDNKIYDRSEGISIAIYNMFEKGYFSSDKNIPYRVDSIGLENLSFDDFKKYLQISDNNILSNIENRYNILKNLSKSLNKFENYFGHDIKRPSNILDYLENIKKDNKINIDDIWNIIIKGLSLIWTNGKDINEIETLDNYGDMWIYKNENKEEIIPIHKLPQWLTYSLLDILKMYGLEITNSNKLTALAEYRNGGLLLDLYVIKLKNNNIYNEVLNKSYEINDDLIIEWRALTIILIDIIHKKINKKLNKNLTMSQILQGGTWKLGRELAKYIRNGQSPINIKLNGLTF